MNNIKNDNILKEQFHANGWILVKKIFSQKEVTEINKKIDSFLKKNIKKYNGKSINFTNNRQEVKINNINSFHNLPGRAVNYADDASIQGQHFPRDMPLKLGWGLRNHAADHARRREALHV